VITLPVVLGGGAADYLIVLKVKFGESDKSLGSEKK
jgi:hypothetical protein